MKTVAFTGGGTGGHIYPGLAIIEALKADYPELEVAWIGNAEGMDRSIVESAGIKFYGIPSGKLRRELSFKNITDIAKIVTGFFAARKILRNLSPSLVFSKGGYVSVPPVRAAASLGIPVFTHESDVTPGLATRLNASRAEKVYVAYEKTKHAFSPAARERVIVSGNPVRRAFYSSDPLRGKKFAGVSDGKPLVLVLGGSQGAAQVNDLVETNRTALSELCVVVHQVGQGNWSAKYGERESPSYRPFPYLREELPDLHAAAALVVARSGAGTLWECAVSKNPMLLIPLSGGATRGDQVVNAEVFREAGAAVAMDPRDTTPETFLETIRTLLADGTRLASMAASATKIASSDASTSIARDIAARIGLAGPEGKTT